MRRILIVTYSPYGHTRKIGRHLARQIEASSREPCEFIYFDIAKDSNRQFPPLLETVVVGVPIRFARVAGKVEKWAHSHRFELMALRASLYLVCLNAADPRPKAREAELRILSEFILVTRWEPAAYRIFAGEIAYPRYPVLLRLLMREISKRQGGPTDLSRSHDLTDYALVDAFAEEIAREIENRHTLKKHQTQIAN